MIDNIRLAFQGLKVSHYNPVLFLKIRQVARKGKYMDLGTRQTLIRRIMDESLTDNIEGYVNAYSMLRPKIEDGTIKVPLKDIGIGCIRVIVLIPLTFVYLVIGIPGKICMAGAIQTMKLMEKVDEW